MNVLSCSINTLKGLYDISGVEVGQHFYWTIGGFQVHAQVLITSWVVIGLLLGSVIVAVRNPQIIPTDGQNFFEYVLEFIRDVSKTQIGEEYSPWVPFIGTMFLFIFVSNWSGAILPWKIMELPHGELAAPTNDINTTVALALLTSHAPLRPQKMDKFLLLGTHTRFVTTKRIMVTPPLTISFINYFIYEFHSNRNKIHIYPTEIEFLVMPLTASTGLAVLMNHQQERLAWSHLYQWYSQELPRGRTLCPFHQEREKSWKKA